MKNKQYSVKVFETTVDDAKKFIDFFEANHALFKDHLILLHGEVTPQVTEYLEAKGLHYLTHTTLPVGRSRKALEEEMAAERIDCEINQRWAEAEISKLSNQLQNNLTVKDTMIRSGQELQIEGDLLLLNRINSGAMVHTTGNLIVTHQVEGAIRCDGNFMMVSASPKANIIFHGVEVDNSLLENKLNRIELKKNEIVITPVIVEKETSWAL
ncbi:MAG TPA: hypothetical protein ENK86_04540 [Campylobacterales bacterium]|nr:hypothetical protein [Campylobacterales bacterium]